MRDPGHEAAPLRIHPASDADLARVYPWLDAMARTWRLPEAMRNGMHVALEEAVMNVATHGFDDPDAGDIVVRARLEDGAVTLVVEDGGRAFNPAVAVSPARPANLMDAPPGGLGLILLRHYCKDIGYERVDGGNRLTLRFPIA